MKRQTAALAAALVTAVALPAVASAQENIITQLFGMIEAKFREDGVHLARVRQVSNNLNQGQNISDTVDLPAGDYVVVGVCDQDCTDYDLIISDAAGQVIGSDVLEDDAPMIHLEGLRAGSYRIESRMPACSVEPCTAAARVYEIAR